MIGNDIVDLQLAKTQSNWQRKGFLEKQFTKNEQLKIQQSENPFLQVWLFWSMKEAAYKCYVQQYQIRFFAPLKFKCFINDKNTNKVVINDETYITNSTITNQYIHTIASKKNLNNTQKELFYIDQNSNQSKTTNEKLIKMLSKKDKEISIKKNDSGVPSLFSDTKKLPIFFSTSHHGNYGSFAFTY